VKNEYKTTKNIFPELIRILVIGNGGRENSLAWALSKCNQESIIFVAPGNGGTEDQERCFRLDIPSDDANSLIKEAQIKNIELVVIGPETPLADGLADKLRQEGIIVFGPGAEGAQLESSKKWAKELMLAAGIPTAKYWTASTKEAALNLLNRIKTPLVIKADGLAAGKGVFVPETIEETKVAINNSFEGKFGVAGNEVVLEEKLQGPEISIFAITDGKRFVLLPPAQDHKRLKDGDKGPNTGGMGAYTPANLIKEKDIKEISEIIIQPTIDELNKRGIEYRGVIYAGLMITQSGPKVIEFNCRFGDPECQALMPLMGREFAKVLYACGSGSLHLAPKLTILKSYSACVVAAAKGYPEDPRKDDEIEFTFQKNSSVEIFHAGTKLNSQGKLLTSGGRVLSLVGQGKDFDEAFNRVYDTLKGIKYEGINYRLDIGNQVRKL